MIVARNMPIATSFRIFRKELKTYMKRPFFLSILLIAHTPLAQAEDIILNGGEVNYADKSLVSSTKNQQVKGAALNSDGTVMISGATGIKFSQNKTANTYTSSHAVTVVPADLAAGGAIHGDTVTISGNEGSISFTDNELRAKTTNDARARVRGGAVKGREVHIDNNEVGSISFAGNMAADEYKAWDATAGMQVDKPKFSCGGALYADEVITVSGNSKADLSFSNNQAGKGGAISAGYGSTMTLSGNGQISFAGNVAAYGGAAYTGAHIYLNNTNTPGYAILDITDNKGVSFSENEARTYGGAIYNQTHSTVRLNDNKGDVSFTGNTATGLGGAIHGQSYSTIELNGNTGSVSFAENKVILETETKTYGGAIHVYSGSTINMNNNARVELCDNTTQTHASAYGGAVALINSSLDINGNTLGVLISGNSAIGTCTKSTVLADAEGGAIYGKTLNIRDNIGTVLVQGNVAQSINDGTAKGGAIYVEEALSVTGNEEVEFRNNLQQDTTQTILRSVYVNSKSDSGALNLSAAAGGSISFYDSLYAAPSSSSYKLTADFNKESSATGSVIFSGKYAEADLLALNSAATAEEIAASRTSTIGSDVTVYHGTLSVEDGAVLQSQGLNVESAAALQLKDGVLEMLDSTSLNLSGMLHAEGSNAMTANEVVVADGATFRLSLSDANREASAARSADAVAGGQALIALSTTALTYDGTYTVQFNSLESLAEGRYVVMDISGSEMTEAPAWSTEGVSVTGLGAGDSFAWSDDGTKLYLVHSVAVPEPATAMLSLLALAGLTARRRRR